MTVCHFDGVEGFAQRADLVNLDQDGVGATLLDAFLEELDVGHEQVVAHQLALAADAVGEFLPAFPVVLVHAVFDRVDRIFGDELFEVCNLLVGREFLAVRVFLHARFELLVVVEVLAVFNHCKFGSGAVHGDFHVVAGLVACVLDGFDDAVESVFNAVEFRSETAFVTNGGAEAAALEHFLQCMEHFGTHAQAFAERGCAYRANHEFLERDGSVAVCATVDDVHHRDRQCVGVGSADVAIERHVKVVCTCLGHCERYAKDGVGTEFRLGGSAVECKHLVVDCTLLERRHSDECGSYDFVDVFNCFLSAFATVAALVAVAQFESFVFAGRCARRN